MQRCHETVTARANLSCLKDTCYSTPRGTEAWQLFFLRNIIDSDAWVKALNGSLQFSFLPNNIYAEGSVCLLHRMEVWPLAICSVSKWLQKCEHFCAHLEKWCAWDGSTNYLLIIKHCVCMSNDQTPPHTKYAQKGTVGHAGLGLQTQHLGDRGERIIESKAK